MSNHTYWPYDEVLLETNFADGQIRLKTPWLEAKTSQAQFNETSLRALKTKLSEKTLDIDDLGLVNDFFQHFEAYPLAYILPTRKLGDSLDTHNVFDASFATGSFSYVLKKMLASCSDLSSTDFEELVSLISRHEWEWDAGAAVQFATLDGGVHPESFFSIVRRFHILEILNSDTGRAVFEELQALAPAEYKASLCSIVRQNHYVTQKCQEALLPALANAQQAAPLLDEFMREERGHDKILAKALMHMEALPETIAVSVQTKALMHLLGVCAERNFLAFAMAVDAFERSNYEDVDPMAKLLSAGGFEKAAEFINLHMKINDHGNHENVAAKFLQFMNICDPSYALEALRLMEVLSVVMCSVSKSAPAPRAYPA